MSERRNKLSKQNRTKAYIAAGLVHVVIIGLMLFNFSAKRETVDAADADKIDVVKARMVDDAQIKQEQDKIKKRERDKKREQERERKRLEDLKKKSKAEEKRLEELKKKKVDEQKKADELEKQRKEIALKKQKEEDKRKKDEAERKKKADEARKKKEADKKRKEENERIKREERELESQRRLNESLAAEEAFIAEQQAKQRATTLMGKYTALITEKVNAVRTISPNFERWRVTKVNVKLSPSGDVKSVRIVKSSGNVQYDRSVETAVRKASPLPIPSVADDAEVNKLFQDLNISFDMSEL